MKNNLFASAVMQFLRDWRGFLAILVAVRHVAVAQGCAKNGERQNVHCWRANIAQMQCDPAALGNRVVVNGQIFCGRLCVAGLGHCLHTLGSGGGLAEGLVGIVCYGRQEALCNLGSLG